MCEQPVSWKKTRSENISKYKKGFQHGVLNCAKDQKAPSRAHPPKVIMPYDKCYEINKQDKVIEDSNYGGGSETEGHLLGRMKKLSYYRLDTNLNN